MALTNALAAQQWAQLEVQLKTGALDQAGYQTALLALLNAWAPSNPAIANLVSQLTTQVIDTIAGLQVIVIRGKVATFAELPAVHANGDAYFVTGDGHGYAWLDALGYWLDLGAFQGPQGSPGQSLLRTVGQPAAGAGNNGDLALDPETGQTYEKTNDAWSAGVSFIGPQGLSAYQVWLAQDGNAGKSEADYLTWLGNAQLVVVQPLIDSATASKAAAAASATQADSDAAAARADRLAADADAAAAHADRQAADTDAANTHADAQATAADRVQTGADRTQTGQDRTAAHQSAQDAAASASQARAIAGGDFQTHDAGLDALAALDGTAGVVEQTGADTFTARPIATATTAVDGALPTLALVKAMLANLVGSAPAALDTLQELAAQLQSDESAATALTNVVAGKASQADLTTLSTAVTTLTGNVYTKAAADAAIAAAISAALQAYYTSSQIDAKLAALGQVKTVNGNAPDANGNVVVPVDASLTARMTSVEREIDHLEMIRVVTAVAPNAVGFLDDYADQSGIDAANSSNYQLVTAGDVVNGTIVNSTPPATVDSTAATLYADFGNNVYKYNGTTYSTFDAMMAATGGTRSTANAYSLTAQGLVVASGSSVSLGYSTSGSYLAVVAGYFGTDAGTVVDKRSDSSHYGSILPSGSSMAYKTAANTYTTNAPALPGDMTVGFGYTGNISGWGNNGKAWDNTPGAGNAPTTSGAFSLGYAGTGGVIRWFAVYSDANITATQAAAATAESAPSTTIKAMTLRSVKATLKFTPARVFHYEAMKLGANAVLNTDVKGSVTRDGGTTWSDGTYALIYVRTDGYGVYELQDGTGKPGVDVSGQPTGQQVAYKLTTTATDRVDFAAANLRGA